MKGWDILQGITKKIDNLKKPTLYTNTLKKLSGNSVTVA